MALVRPKKRPVIGSVKPIASSTGIKGAAGLKPPAPLSAMQYRASTPKVTQAPAPAAPAPAVAPKPVVTGPPMPTIQSTADRNSARYDFGTTIGDINTQLRNLAASYGGAPKVDQFSYAPDAAGKWNDTTNQMDVAQNQPGSTLEVLARNLAASKQNVNDTNEAQNTFFSGRRLDQLGQADTGYGADTASAQREYEAAVAQLHTALTQAIGTRNTNLSQADINDILAAQQAAPEAQAPDAPAEDQGGAGAPADTIQTVAGVNITPSNWVKTSYTNSAGHEVRVYADGHKEVWDPTRQAWKRV